MRSKNTKKSGFTLLELMIGAGVLIVALVGLIAAYSTCFTLNETARNLTIAINSAQREIERIRNLSFDDVDDEDGTNFEILELDDDESEGIVEVDSSDPDLLEVTVTVCWRQKGGRVFGEDANLNGVFDAGEDTNGNGQLDSPAQLVTSISRR